VADQHDAVEVAPADPGKRRRTGGADVYERRMARALASIINVLDPT
jgi:hypothetical protein